MTNEVEAHALMQDRLNDLWEFKVGQEYRSTSKSYPRWRVRKVHPNGNAELEFSYYDYHAKYTPYPWNNFTREGWVCDFAGSIQRARGAGEYGQLVELVKSGENQ